MSPAYCHSTAWTLSARFLTHIAVKNRAKSQHWSDRSHISSSHCTPCPFQVHHPSNTMYSSRSADSDKLERLKKVFTRRPQLQLREAMFVAKYSAEEIDNAACRRSIQRALPGGSISRFRAHVARLTPPPPKPPDRSS